MMKMSFKMSLKEMDRENIKYGSRKLQAYWGEMAGIGRQILKEACLVLCQ